MNNLQLIEKVLYYIDEHIGEELTYERLAEVFGYSSFHFHKIFSSVTELSIAEYIRKRRLTIAHKILCETTENVADICYRVGFNSIQTFNRVFRDTFGMQPLVARERQAKRRRNCNRIDENALFDFEYYDERWDCQFGAAQMDIYVPVRRMERTYNIGGSEVNIK